MPEIIAIASDHAGYDMKSALVTVLQERGYRVLDLGPDGRDPVDYPDMAGLLAEAIKAGGAGRGVLICGSGIGISIAANRYSGIRAALCHSAETAKLARQHNDANVLALGARVTALDIATECLGAFLDTPFEGGRHAGRVAKLG